MAVDRRDVEDLHYQLRVGPVEEPERAGVAGEWHRMGGGGPGARAEGGVEPEAVAGEAEAGRRGRATRGAEMLHGLAAVSQEEDAPSPVVAGEDLFGLHLVAVAGQQGGGPQRLAGGLTKLRGACRRAARGTGG